MGGCQNHGPLLGTLNNRCRIIIGTQKGTLILTTSHIGTLDPLGTPQGPVLGRLEVKSGHASKPSPGTVRFALYVFFGGG